MSDTAQNQSPPAVDPRTIQPTAVVIDDSAASRRLLGHMLEQAGIIVIGEGETGAEAITLYERLRPTLLMLDIVLPVMDGVTTARLLLSRFPAATVVMCTSINSREKIVACRNAGVAHFILKPFAQEKINEVTTVLLARQTAASAVAQ